MIKAIFFDFDGVLTTDAKGSLTMSKTLCDAVPGLSVEEVLACYREDIELLNAGQMLFKDVWQRMCAAFHIAPDDDLLLDVLRTVPKNNAMFDFARSLAGHYTLGIITDNCRERMDVLNSEMHLAELFDPIIVSGAEHASKRDGTTKIFDIALAKAGCLSEESVFIDNQEKNLITPRVMGMKTYFYDDMKNDIAALRTSLAGMGVNLERSV